MANHDSLTDAPNRLAFQRMLAEQSAATIASRWR
jgi:GGDEF domain-containing protein